jgi:hypothetical protein
MIGTSVAPYRKTNGGVIFGMYFKTTSALLAARVTSATSSSTSYASWRTC